MGNEQTNVELVRRAFDAWNRNDWEELAELYHPQVVVAAPEGFPEAGEVDGWPAVKRRYQDLKEAWETEEIQVREMFAEGDQVVADVRWFGTGRTSGLPLSLDVSDLVTIRDGRILRIEFHWSPQEARETMRVRAERRP